MIHFTVSCVHTKSINMHDSYFSTNTQRISIRSFLEKDDLSKSLLSIAGEVAVSEWFSLVARWAGAYWAVVPHLVKGTEL